MVIEPGEHGGDVADQKVGHPNTHRFADTLAWFDHYLKGAPLPEALRPGYIVYDNGADRWTHHDQWPQPAKTMVLHLDRLEAAHGCESGRLTEQNPTAGGTASFVYDPRNPVPTRGGAYLVMANVASHSAAEQKNDLCDRTDVLSFRSDQFAAPRLIAGSIRIRLEVSSDAPDTAFTVKLSEHFADGRVLNIRDDISTLSLRNGATSRRTYTPGEKVEVAFTLPPVSWQLQPGSHLRLDVSSSNAPVFYPHPNRAGLWSAVADPVAAHQSVHGGTVTVPFAD
jgi:putative CocE/NonD family hydrolase